MEQQKNQRIAIIGTGVSGLGAAYLLHRDHDITVFEQAGRCGGHSRTVNVDTPDGPEPVDTGFIVFNTRNYPHLTGLFSHLNIEAAPSSMSFGVTIDNGWLEYGAERLGGMFAQRRNLFRGRYLRMLRDILRFNREAKRYLTADPALTLGQCLEEMRLGPWFRDYYLLAMGGAIWSAPPEQMLAFPAQSFIRFFDNHGLLTVNDQPRWQTVRGGSRVYVERITQGFRDRIRLNCGVVSVTRSGDGVSLRDVHGETHHFDAVVMACHAPQALAMIDEPSQREAEILSAFRTQPNRAVLHGDTRFMPRRRAVWASWVYHSAERRDKSGQISLSYWMNNLQPLATSQPLFVTLNPAREPDPALVYYRHDFAHPVFDAAAIRAQAEMAEIQGKDRLWFAGAWLRHGFHEDGLLSAVNVARGFGVEPPWK